MFLLLFLLLILHLLLHLLLLLPLNLSEIIIFFYFDHFCYCCPNAVYPMLHPTPWEGFKAVLPNRLALPHSCCSSPPGWGRMWPGLTQYLNRREGGDKHVFWSLVPHGVTKDQVQGIHVHYSTVQPNAV